MVVLAELLNLDTNNFSTHTNRFVPPRGHAREAKLGLYEILTGRQLFATCISMRYARRFNPFVRGSSLISTGVRAVVHDISRERLYVFSYSHAARTRGETRIV